jgi:hypothetical protein
LLCHSVFCLFVSFCCLSASLFQFFQMINLAKNCNFLLFPEIQMDRQNEVDGLLEAKRSLTPIFMHNVFLNVFISQSSDLNDSFRHLTMFCLFLPNYQTQFDPFWHRSTVCELIRSFQKAVHEQNRYCDRKSNIKKLNESASRKSDSSRKYLSLSCI